MLTQVLDVLFPEKPHQDIPDAVGLTVVASTRLPGAGLPPRIRGAATHIGGILCVDEEEVAMPSPPIKDLTTVQLTKRRRFAAFLLWVIVGVSALNLIVGAWTGRTELFAVAAAMFAIGYPMYAGKKKAEAELARRQGHIGGV
jgi:hypothetical protein